MPDLSSYVVWAKRKRAHKFYAIIYLWLYIGVFIIMAIPTCSLLLLQTIEYQY